MRHISPLLALFVCLCCANLQAQTKTYVVGVEEFDYYPLYAFGKRASLSEDLLTAFAEHAGIKLDFKPLDINRLYHELLHDGSVDFKYPDNAYWGGDKKQGVEVIYSDPAVPFTDGVLVPKQNQGKGITSIKQLGMPTGFTPSEYSALEASGNLKLKRHYEMDRLAKDVMLGKTQGMYSNVVVAKHLIDSNYGGSLSYDPGLPHTDSHYHLSTVKHPDVIEQFNAFLKANPQLLETLKAKYITQ